MISLVAAISIDNQLGYKNKLLCHLPNDLQHFKKLTQGNICVFGRKTYQSIGKPLPQRHNIILSRKIDFDVPIGAYLYHSVEDILREYESYSNKEAKLYICGGSEVYKQFLPYADTIELTIIDNKFPNADSYFPRLDDSWVIKQSIRNKADENNPYDHYFVTYEKCVENNINEISK